jgi:hypothetical protein
VVAGFGQWITELEKIRTGSGHIPEHARVQLTKVDVDVHTKSVVSTVRPSDQVLRTQV